MKVLLLLIPVVNVAAAMVWFFCGEDTATRRLGGIALVVLVGITLGTLVYGYTGVAALAQRLAEFH